MVPLLMMARVSLPKEVRTWDDDKNIQTVRSQGCISIDAEVNKKANMYKREGEISEANANA